MRRLIKGLGTMAALAFGPGLVLAGPVNINEADEETLAEELDGVGAALAAAIVRDREENGPFEEPEQITRVRGIGERVLEDNKEFILVKNGEADED
jgi:competence protein ComEA